MRNMDRKAPGFRFEIVWTSGERGVLTVPALSKREAVRGVAEYIESTGGNATFKEVGRDPGPSLLAALYDAEAALTWEDPYRETGITKEERVAESLVLIRAAIAKAEGRA